MPRSWLQDTFGLGYDQRNALVVGAAMGLAVMPVVFSVSEQAIGGVPAHLVQGSLALGATRWQTGEPNHRPDRRSGHILGDHDRASGRAVGETMIVLMASGNTPILDLNVFQGMRTFAANIAVELPEGRGRIVALPNPLSHRPAPVRDDFRLQHRGGSRPVNA